MAFSPVAGRFGQPTRYPAPDPYTVQSKSSQPVPPTRKDSPPSSPPSAKSSVESLSRSGSSDSEGSPPGSPISRSGHNFGVTVDPVFGFIPSDQGDKIQALFDAWAVYADSKGKKGKKGLEDTFLLVVQVAAEALLKRHTRVVEYDPGKQEVDIAFEENVDGKKQFRVFDRYGLNEEVNAICKYRPTPNPFADIPRDFFPATAEKYLKWKKKQPLTTQAIVLLLPLTYGCGAPSAKVALDQVKKLGSHGKNTIFLDIVMRRIFEATWRRHANQLPIPVFDPKAQEKEKAAAADRQRTEAQAQRARIAAAQNSQRVAELSAQVLSAEPVFLGDDGFKEFLKTVGVH